MEIWQIITIIIGFITTYTVPVVWCIRQEGKIKMTQEQIRKIDETQKEIIKYLDKIRDKLYESLIRKDD